jgi:hypothetical protein
MKAQDYYVLGNVLLVVSILIIGTGVYIGFIEDHSFTIPQQIVAHLGIIVSAVTLKFGYVIRLAATQILDDTMPGSIKSEEPVEPDLSTFVSFEDITEPDSTRFVRVEEAIETDMSLFTGINPSIQPKPVMCALV